jgi:hypothetical protein
VSENDGNKAGGEVAAGGEVDMDGAVVEDVDQRNIDNKINESLAAFSQLESEHYPAHQFPNWDEIHSYVNRCKFGDQCDFSHELVS